MRRTVLSVLCSLTLAASSGCSLFWGSVNREFAEASKKNADVVFPEYENYLDADGSLSDDDRRIRKNTVKDWRALIDKALREDE